MQDVNVVNIRTDEIVVSNRDGHFMISGRQGDELRFIKAGYERLTKKIVSQENTESPMNIRFVRQTIQIPEVEIKQGLTGNLKIDSKLYNKPQKVEKLLKEMDRYIFRNQIQEYWRRDPRICAAERGRFSIGKVKINGMM